MIKDIINKLKNRKQKLENLNDVSKQNTTEEDSSTLSFDIIISKDNTVFKVEISDDVPGDAYFDRMDEIDKYKVVNLISNNILFKGGRGIFAKKGTYYIIEIDNKIYNMHLDSNNIEIDERIKLDDITEERIIRYNTSNNDYGYFSAKHDKSGSTFYNMYYDKGGFDFGKLTFTKKEAHEEINNLISNMEKIKELTTIIDIDLLKENILKDIEDIIDKENKFRKQA